MDVIFAALLTIAISALSRISVDEFKAFCPKIVEWLVTRAVAKMPEEMQERFAEEWRAALEEIPGDIAKLWIAFGYTLVAQRLAYGFCAWEMSLKRIVDIAVASIAICVFMPLLLAIALCIWVYDRKVPLLWHERVGLRGNRFRCLKFRTMVIDGDAVLSAYLATNLKAQAEWAATRRLFDDPRLTPVGRILRKTSLDDLPQIWNVLLGEMSLVGPRPIAQDDVDRYGGAFAVCFSVKPGVTGLWQVSGRSDTTYAERVAFDLDYATCWSLRRDLAIMLRTVPAILTQRGCR